MKSGQIIELLRTARLPLVPSALSNVVAGAICAGFSSADALPLTLICLAAGLFYSSGMAWNDYFDATVDAKERPDRPIPSGAVSRSMVGWFAAILMGAGLTLVWGLEFSRHAVGISGYLATALCLLILAYDGGGKKTPLGPLLMGGCRFLNILLGWSVVTGEIGQAGIFQAGAIGLFVAGITVVAKDEAGQPERLSVSLGFGLSATGLVGVLLLPAFTQEGSTPAVFPYLLFLLILRLAFPAVKAIGNPSQATVQGAVLAFLKSLVYLDAFSSLALAGWQGLWCLGFLALSWLLTKIFPRQRFT